MMKRTNNSKRRRMNGRSKQFRHRVQFESLEDRRMLAVTAELLGSGDVLISGSSASDDVALRLDDTGRNLEVSDPAGVTDGGGFTVIGNTGSVPLSSITGQIQVELSSGDDILTIDNSNGLVTAPIHYDGGTGTDDAAVLGTDRADEFQVMRPATGVGVGIWISAFGISGHLVIEAELLTAEGLGGDDTLIVDDYSALGNTELTFLGGDGRDNAEILGTDDGDQFMVMPAASGIGVGVWVWGLGVHGHLSVDVETASVEAQGGDDHLQVSDTSALADTALHFDGGTGNDDAELIGTDQNETYMVMPTASRVGVGIWVSALGYSAHLVVTVETASVEAEGGDDDLQVSDTSRAWKPKVATMICK
jgi:hypothetical protein